MRAPIKTGKKRGLKVSCDEGLSIHISPESCAGTCPAGQILKKRNYHKKRNHYEYKTSSKICANCKLRNKCTRAKDGRSIKRHVRQDELDFMLKQANSRKAQSDIKTRQHLMERLFARGTRYGFKRAGWCRLWRVQIQEYLTATIQNLMVFLRNIKEPAPALGMIPEESGKKEAFLTLQELFFYLKRSTITNARFPACR